MLNGRTFWTCVGVLALCLAPIARGAGQTPNPRPPNIILIYADEDTVAALTPEQDDSHVAQHLRVREQLVARGKIGLAVRLSPTSTAQHLRTAGGPEVIDGPFAETKEQLLGFYMVDCESQEEAMQIARSLPSLGSIFEVRPVKLFFPGGEPHPR